MPISQNLPNLRQLQYLVALGQHKSFSRAAEACHVTQSTFSAGIAALEEQLGQKLIIRNTRNVSFTALGEEVFHKADQLLHQALEISTAVKKSNKPLSGPLRLGMIPTIAPYLLPKLLPLLQKDWPDLELQLNENITDVLLSQLERGQIDLALMAFPYVTPGLEQKIIFSENFILASPPHLETAKAVTIVELNDIELLLLEEGHCLRAHALAACRTDKVSKTFRSTSLPTLIQMVKNGYGSTLLPEMATKPETLPKGIQLRTFKSPAPKRDIGLAWRKNHIPDKDLQYLAKSIKTAASS